MMSVKCKGSSLKRMYPNLISVADIFPVCDWLVYFGLPLRISCIKQKLFANNLLTIDKSVVSKKHSNFRIIP